MSYSNPTNLAARMSPRIYAGLTGDGVTPNDSVGQAALNAASRKINIKIGTRYVAPFTAPADQVTAMALLEEDIAQWLLWVKAGFGPQETAAAAAKSLNDEAIKTLDTIAASTLDLPGVELRDDGSDEDASSGFIMESEPPHYNPPDGGGGDITGGF